MKSKHLKQEVQSAFQELIGSHFTVSQAVAAYMAGSFCSHSDVKLARQFVYRNIKRLIEAGEIEIMSADGGRQKYLLTSRFALRLVAEEPVFNAKRIVPTAPLSNPRNLTERLNHQKVELLTAMGEAEEYDAIYKEMPEMRCQIQLLYNDSRDRCSKLLGKVKALENLISLSAR